MHDIASTAAPIDSMSQPRRPSKSPATAGDDGVPFPEYIPAHAGQGVHRKRVQRHTLTVWSALVATAVVGFNARGGYLAPSTRAAALSLAFPGAGYIACANLAGVMLFLFTLALLPLCLFAWFGAGALAFPMALWLSSVPGAYWTASSVGIYENADWVVGAMVLTMFLYFNRSSANARRRAYRRRELRNRELPNQLEAMDATAVAPPAEADRELSLQELRRVQWLFDIGLQAIDDFSNYTIVDQFQTSSVRYQLYETMYCLAIYQGVYAPSFHGYCSETYRRAIAKSLTPFVLGFWKWETLWGKFTTDFEPIMKDNIMVSGFLLQGIALYVSNSRDMRYSQRGSLPFRVTPNHTYTHDIHSLSQALVSQWASNRYTMFPCEPSWIYSPCNLQGMVGQVVYDRVFGTRHAANLASNFDQAITSEMMEPDGSVIPIRSELTGFTIPGICGALGDLANAMMCRGHMDNIARRMWAIFRNTNIHFNHKDELEMRHLVGADLMDPGYYRKSSYAILPHVGQTAGEFGDEKVRLRALERMENEIGSTVSTTGAVSWKKEEASFCLNTGTIKSFLLRREDWKNLVLKGPSQEILDGPILDQVPYPGLLVAKARSLDAQSLHLVLYPSAEAGQFEIGITRLQANGKYIHQERSRALTADESGNLMFDVLVDGRTPVTIVPVPNN